MKRTALLPALALLAGLLAGQPALAQKVAIEHDADYDSSELETFAWKATPETSLIEQSPALHSRIVRGIQYYLKLGGLRQVDDNADILVTYHASASQSMSVDVGVWGYGYPSGWNAPYRGGATAVGVGHTRSYVKGTLVVDVWDTASGELVWRGTAKLSTARDSNAVNRIVDKSLEKMVNKWWKIRHKAKR